MNEKFYRKKFIQNMTVFLYKACESPIYAEKAAEYFEQQMPKEFNPYYHFKFVPVYAFEKSRSIGDEDKFSHNRLCDNNGYLLFDLLSANLPTAFSTAGGIEIWVMDNLQIRVFGVYIVESHSPKGIERFSYRYPIQGAEYEISTLLEKLHRDEFHFIDTVIDKAKAEIKKGYCERYVCFECPNMGVCQ